MSGTLLKDKVVLITGASRGIGRAIAESFASEGAAVAFTYHSNEDKAKSLAATLRAQGVEAKGYRSDASDFSQAETLISDVVKDFTKIDVLINNAGITRDGLILRMTEKAWDEVLQVNLKSCFNTTRHLSRYFLKQRKGVIVNITSVVGVKGNPGQANYVASKAGIIGFTKTVAQELGALGVRCNAVAPGLIESDMTNVLDEKVLEEWKRHIPLRRIGKPEEVAQVCLFLASDMATYVNGQTLQVDGGMI